MSFPFQWYTSLLSIWCMLYCQYLLVTPQITASLCGKTGITQHWSYCCQNWAESGSTDTVLVCLLLHSTCILHLFDFWLSDCDKFLLFELLRWKNRLWSRTVVGRSQTVSQSPCTALKAAVRAVMGTASGLWEMGGIPWSHNILQITQNSVEIRNFPPFIWISWAESWQDGPIANHVSYPTDRPWANGIYQSFIHLFL